MSDKLITVITPTYNRAHTLPMCYKSLCSQTDNRFLWLIIDDGSSDGTEELVKQWINEGKIEIKYLKKSNGGKASALNVGIDNLSTIYTVCLDSDDVFYENTVQLAIEELQKTNDDPKCCGILALRNNPDGSVMGRRPIPSQLKTITAYEIFLKYRLKTELICFYKTEILKRYRFPEFPGEKFVSPAWMQYAISTTYYFIPSWDKLCLCEYLSDGITMNKKRIIIKNPKGYTSVKKFSFNGSYHFKQMIKHGIMYDYGCILSNDKDWLDGVKHKVLAICLRPVAYVVYIHRKNNVKI